MSVVESNQPRTNIGCVKAVMSCRCRKDPDKGSFSIRSIGFQQMSKFDMEVKVNEVWSVEVTQEMIDDFRKENYKERDQNDPTDLQIAQEIATEDYHHQGYVVDTDVELL